MFVLLFTRWSHIFQSLYPWFSDMFVLKISQSLRQNKSRSFLGKEFVANSCWSSLGMWWKIRWVCANAAYDFEISWCLLIVELASALTERQGSEWIDSESTWHNRRRQGNLSVFGVNSYKCSPQFILCSYIEIYLVVNKQQKLTSHVEKLAQNLSGAGLQYIRLKRHDIPNLIKGFHQWDEERVCWKNLFR